MKHIKILFAVLFCTCVYSQHTIASKQYLFENIFFDIIEQIQKHKYFEEAYKGITAPYMGKVIMYRETDRSHTFLSQDMYKSIEKFIANQLPLSHATLIECVECDINKVIKRQSSIEKIIRFDTTAQLLQVADDLLADHVMVWGLIPGESSIVYIRFVNAITGMILWSTFIYD